jgi:hypothetical protein
VLIKVDLDLPLGTPSAAFACGTHLLLIRSFS